MVVSTGSAEVIVRIWQQPGASVVQWPGPHVVPGGSGSAKGFERDGAHEGHDIDGNSCREDVRKVVDGGVGKTIEVVFVMEGVSVKEIVSVGGGKEWTEDVTWEGKEDDFDLVVCLGFGMTGVGLLLARGGSLAMSSFYLIHDN